MTRLSALALALLCSPALASDPPPDTLVWLAPIVAFTDGDSGRALDMTTGKIERFRMAGYDTPETSEKRANCIQEQRHGVWASAQANQFALGGPLILEWRDKDGDGKIDRDRYKRGLATLWRATKEGEKLGSLYDHLVEGGFALPYEGGTKPDWCRFIKHLARKRTAKSADKTH